MFPSILFTLYFAAKAVALVLPRDNGPASPGCSTVPDPGLVAVPDTGKADNTFNNGKPQQTGDFPWGSSPIPDLYQPRDIDLPFGWMFHGKVSMFPGSQLSNPAWVSDDWSPNKSDFANQSACGIPHNAYNQKHAAIHPYFLKYAGLDRYCMQDVCLSLWPESGSPDMIVKVTDICGTDPSDPTYCPTPYDIKVDRSVMQVMEGISGDGSANLDLKQDVWPKGGTYWHFTKCWGYGLPQPAYQDNWWGQPPLPNNFFWDVDATRMQTMNNQKSYPTKGWPAYGNGMEIPSDEMKAKMTMIPDWVAGQEPAWAPIAGGKGFGTPDRSHGPPPAMYPGKSTALAGGGGGSTGRSRSGTDPTSNTTASGPPQLSLPPSFNSSATDSGEDCEEL